MYYYIVDPQKISQRDFERVQNLLYSSLSEYRISGEVMRVTGLRSITQLVENAFAHGAKTIVGVGGDDTLTDIVNALRGRDMVVGFIPIAPSEIGKILGVNDVQNGAKTIALRRITEMDLGKVNENYFLSKLNFGFSDPEGTWSQNFNFKLIQGLMNLPPIEIKFSADSQYQGSLTVIAGKIINWRHFTGSEETSNPTDGKLDVLFLPQLSKWQILRFRQEILSGQFEKIPKSSQLHVKKIEILSPVGLALKSGDRILGKTPAIVEILPQALKIIVGRNRGF